MNTDLADTIIALEGGLANINVNAALVDVEGWRTRLGGLSVPHAGELRAELEKLAGLLASGEFQDLGDVLARLGNLTQATVDYAPADQREDLQRLGDLLSNAGTQVI